MIKNIYIKTFLAVSTAFICVAFVFISLISFFAPLAMAEKYNELNFTDLAYICYNKEYKDSDNILDIFFMLNYATENKEYNGVITYAEKLLNHPEINDFIDYLNEKAKNTNNIYAYNELNYIENSYVNALIKTRNFNKAKEYSLSKLLAVSFDENSTFSILSLADKVKFCENEIPAIKTAYTVLQRICMDDFNINGSRFENKVMALRLCDFALALNKLTCETTYLNDITAFRVVING